MARALTQPPRHTGAVYRQARLEFPVVSIPPADLRSMWRIGQGFDGAIRLVRNRMAAEGIDYRLPFRSWFNESGALCHQNFLSSPRGRSYDPEKERWI